MHALSVELFGKSIPFPLFPVAKDIVGIGLTDSPLIADRLQEKLNFTNTFIHDEPRLDLMDPAPGLDGSYDFIIASEVFEHLPAPVERGFENLWRLLRPEGFVVFTVPWSPDGHTIEHFPDLYDWQIVNLRGGPVLVNRTENGEVQAFGDLSFHGGWGDTLELRLFSKDDLVVNFKNARFGQIEIAEMGANPDYGVILQPWSRGIVARKTVRRSPWTAPRRANHPLK